MDPHHRRQLEARAFPEGGVTPWRRTFWTLLLVAAGLAIAEQRFMALIVAALALPTIVRYVRREWALGALIAEDRRRAAELLRVPVEDMRARHRSLL